MPTRELATDNLTVKKTPSKLRKKFIHTALSGLMAVSSLMAIPDKADAYALSHKPISSNAIFILKHDKGVSEVDKLYETIDVNTFMEDSTKPDIDETEGLPLAIGTSRNHFYDPTTGTNFMGEKTNTANHEFCDHYDKAVAAAKAGDKVLAGDELARSAHFLQDMCVPFHSANLPNFESPKGTCLTHADYESWVDRNFYSFVVTSAPASGYDFVANNSNWIVGHKAAENSRQYIGLVKSWYYEADNNNKRNATIKTLPEAQKLTAELLHKFLKDTGKI